MLPPKPEIVLTTKAETLAWLTTHDETFNWCSHPVKSLWLCDELNRFEADSCFVYNRPAQDRIARENGMTPEESERRVKGHRNQTEGGLLGALVYLAQGYRAEMKLERDGWVRATQVNLAAFEGETIPAHNNGSLSGDIEAKVRRVGERYRLCPPRSRNKAYAEYEDWWIKPPGGTTLQQPSAVKVEAA